MSQPIAHPGCRLYAHHWRPYDAWRDGRKWVQILICQECRSKRRDHIDSNGNVTTRSYAMVKGYLQQGRGRVTTDQKALIRLSVLINQTKQKRE